MIISFDWISSIYYTYKVCDLIQDICKDHLVVSLLALIIISICISIPMSLYFYLKIKRRKK